jgi:folate-binding Fe-S cluster repair protein YgfZ
MFGLFNRKTEGKQPLDSFVPLVSAQSAVCFSRNFGRIADVVASTKWDDDFKQNSDAVKVILTEIDTFKEAKVIGQADVQIRIQNLIVKLIENCSGRTEALENILSNLGVILQPLSEAHIETLSYLAQDKEQNQPIVAYLVKAKVFSDVQQQELEERWKVLNSIFYVEPDSVERKQEQQEQKVRQNAQQVRLREVYRDLIKTGTFARSIAPNANRFAQAMSAPQNRPSSNAVNAVVSNTKTGGNVIQSHNSSSSVTASTSSAPKLVMGKS